MPPEDRGGPQARWRGADGTNRPEPFSRQHLPWGEMSIRNQFVSTFLCGLFAGCPSAQQLAIVPATPTPLDLVRLRYTHVGCTNPDSLQLMQSANRITVQAERILLPDCGTIAGYYEEFTLGRLPTGNYDAELVVNPPAGTLGPSVLVGVAHFSVARLPPTASLHPHENYSDSWWNPQESGWALNVFHAGDTLIANWAVYDASGQPTWYALLSGAWRRDANNMLRYG